MKEALNLSCDLDTLSSKIYQLYKIILIKPYICLSIHLQQDFETASFSIDSFILLVFIKIEDCLIFYLLLFEFNECKALPISMKHFSTLMFFFALTYIYLRLTSKNACTPNYLI